MAVLAGADLCAQVNPNYTSFIEKFNKTMRYPKTRRQTVLQSQKVLQSLFSTAVVASLAVGVLVVAGVLDSTTTSAQQPRVFNPFRASDTLDENNFIQANPILKRTGPQSFGDSVLEDASGIVSHSDSWTGSATDALVNDAPKTSGQLNLLVDGMIMLPTVGHFVQQGHQWAFVPVNSKATSFVQAMNGAQQKPENNFRTVSAINDLRSSTLTSVVLVPSNPLREHSVDSDRFSLSADKPKVVSKSIGMQKLIVTDNLMFRRALIEMQTDASATQWTVTGQISRYDGEPQLEIRTAKKFSKTN